MVDIPVEKLRAVLELLTRRMDGDKDVISLEREEFWSIPRGQAYDVYEEPHELTIGMLSDSWGHLEAMLSDPERAVGHGYVWLAEVLRAIGDESSR